MLLRNSNLSLDAHLDTVQNAVGSNVLLVKGFESVKKQHVDAIISRSRIACNKTGNAGMTVGGTGDVLAGLAAGLLAQETDLFKSACAAAYANGAAGGILLKKYGYGFTASDLLQKIPEALKPMWSIK